jgi:S-adenosyl-L-methionine hydrolase (adenosine-forming)
MITLLTDFGQTDSFVGVMKGVIATIAPTTAIIDLTHDIPPQNIWKGSLEWQRSFLYFPKDTIHLGIVDPSVGSARRAIAVAFPSGLVVVPDNGLITGILQLETPIAAVELTNSNYWRTTQPSSTFHGRDIFAAVAAHLAKGVALSELGQEIDQRSLVQLPVPAVIQQSETTWQGIVQDSDRFGNLITNLPGSLVAGKSWRVEIGDHKIPGQFTYAAANPRDAVALVGSENWIEIAVVNGNAWETLRLGVGATVRLLIAL